MICVFQSCASQKEKDTCKCITRMLHEKGECIISWKHGGPSNLVGEDDIQTGPLKDWDKGSHEEPMQMVTGSQKEDRYKDQKHCYPYAQSVTLATDTLFSLYYWVTWNGWNGWSPWRKNIYLSFSSAHCPHWQKPITPSFHKLKSQGLVFLSDPGYDGSNYSLSFSAGGFWSSCHHS